MKMATGGYSAPKMCPTVHTKEAPATMVYPLTKPKVQNARCGACNHPSTDAKCKFFCESCDMFICKECQYHMNVGSEDSPDDYIHETNTTVGASAKKLATGKKQELEKQLQCCENIRNAKSEYRQYLEICVSKCKSGEETFQKAINEINYDLRRLHELGEKITTNFDNLKAVYNSHDAVALIKNRHLWKDFTLKLRNIERSESPRICMTEDGQPFIEYPTVTLENYCLFRGIRGQDLSPHKIKRAWVLHAGSLYVFNGGYHFWDDYYKSQIRPFVTLAEDKNDEILLFLMQISGFVGNWSRNDIEMSGLPFTEGVKTDRFGSTFILCDSENAVYVHRDSHVIKVQLPKNGNSESFSPIILCVDTGRDMLCVYAKSICDYEDEVYVYKIVYSFDGKPKNQPVRS